MNYSALLGSQTHDFSVGSGFLVLAEVFFVLAVGFFSVGSGVLC